MRAFLSLGKACASFPWMFSKFTAVGTCPLSYDSVPLTSMITAFCDLMAALTSAMLISGNSAARTEKATRPRIARESSFFIFCWRNWYYKSPLPSTEFVTRLSAQLPQLRSKDALWLTIRSGCEQDGPLSTLMNLEKSQRLFLGSFLTLVAAGVGFSARAAVLG